MYALKSFLNIIENFFIEGKYQLEIMATEICVYHIQ